MLTQKDGYIQLVQQGADRTDSVPSPDAGNLVMYATNTGVVVENSDGNQVMLDLPSITIIDSPVELDETLTEIFAFTVPAGSDCGYELEINLTGTLTPDATSTSIIIGVSINGETPNIAYVVPSANPVDDTFGGSYRFILRDVDEEDEVRIVGRKLVADDTAEVTYAVVSYRRFARFPL